MKYILVLVMTLLLGGCHLYRKSREVTVHLPHRQEWELPGLGEPWYLIRWPDENGKDVSLRIDGGQETFGVTIPAGRDVPISSSLYGKYPGPSGFIAAGETGPVHLEEDLYELIDLFVELSEIVNRRVSAVSIGYWVSSIPEPDECPGDYGMHLEHIDREQVRISIITGKVSSPPIILQDTAEVKIESLPPGRWKLSEYPMKQFNHRGGEVLLRLPVPGMYRLICPVYYQMLEIILDESGASSVMLRSLL